MNEVQNNQGDLKDPTRKDGGEVLKVGSGNTPPTAIVFGGGTNEGSTYKDELDAHVIQREEKEQEIKNILYTNKLPAKNTIAVTGTLKDNGDLDNLELGESPKLWDRNMPVEDWIDAKKENNPQVNIEDSPCDMLSLKTEIALMKDTVSTQATVLDEQTKLLNKQTKLLNEQTKLVENMKKEVEDLVSSNEETRSLVITRSPNINETSDDRNVPTGNKDPEKGAKTRSVFGRTLEVMSGSHDESYSIDCDTFSLMTISPVCSLSWNLGFVTYCCQMTLGVMILLGQINESEDSSLFGIPFKVDDYSVNVAQFFAIILCLATQNDILSSIRSFLLMGIGSNWIEFIDEKDGQPSCSLWIVRVGIPNIFKLSQGLVVTFVSFVIIVQNKETIDLLKDFTSLMIVSELDEILFNLASYGYLGEELRQQTKKFEDEEGLQIRSSTSSRFSDSGRKNAFLFIRCIFAAILFAMFAGWGTILLMQRQGEIFQKQFPGCGKENYDLAYEKFGNDKCYGGPFNTIQCKYEDGDCANFNTAYPSCNGKDLADLHNVEEEMGNGSCNMTFAIEQCEYDGGDCCPYNITQSVLFGDGKCDGGMYNTKGCLYDFGDCDSFDREYPNCTLDDASLISESSAGIILGDSICDGGAYNSEECGFEYGDCVKGQIGGDVMLSGVRSPIENKINFEMWMSADNTKLLVQMPQTNAVGEYDLATKGKIAGHKYNSYTLTWVHDEGMDKERLQNEGSLVEFHSMAVSGDGSVIAVGSPNYDNDGFGHVTISDFWGLRNNHVLTGKEKGAWFGWQVDLTGDGTRIAVSSPSSDANGFSDSGRIQIFEKNEELSEELWTQVGNDILGKKNNDYIGGYYVGLNSLDGTRVFFSAGVYNIPQLQTYQIDSSSQEWVELATDTPIILRQYIDQRELITITADGNRFAVSSFNHNPTDTESITIYDWISNANGGSWNQLGPPMSSPSNENGFGRSISMGADGTLLAISAVDPECDGWSRFEQGFYSNLLEGASTALCATGSIQLYHYNPSNPPWRPFTRLPYILDINSQRILDTQQQVRENTILGLKVSLSGDGSVLTVSGYDIDGDFGFVKVFNVKDLFYVDCLVRDPAEIGNGDCHYNGIEPYYTEECGYDGGDCPLPSAVEGYDDCKVAYPSYIVNEVCEDALPYNSEACNYDGGDCPPPSPVEGYPSCFVSKPEYIGNGLCSISLPYNSYECGFDGGDCRPAEFTPTSSPSKSMPSSKKPSVSMPSTKKPSV